MPMSDDDIRNEQRRRLRIPEEQRARFGGYSPPYVIAEIEDLQRALGIFEGTTALPRPPQPDLVHPYRSQARADAEETLAIADHCEYRLKQADIYNMLARMSLDKGDRMLMV